MLLNLADTLTSNCSLCVCVLEIPCAAISGAGAKTVPAAEGAERGFYWRHRILQPVSYGCQLPTGTHTHIQVTDTFMHTPLGIRD